MQSASHPQTIPPLPPPTAWPRSGISAQLRCGRVAVSRGYVLARRVASRPREESSQPAPTHAHTRPHAHTPTPRAPRWSAGRSAFGLFHGPRSLESGAWSLEPGAWSQPGASQEHQKLSLGGGGNQQQTFRSLSPINVTRRPCHHRKETFLDEQPPPPPSQPAAALRRRRRRLQPHNDPSTSDGDFHDWASVPRHTPQPPQPPTRPTSFASFLPPSLRPAVHCVSSARVKKLAGRIWGTNVHDTPPG